MALHAALAAAATLIAIAFALSTLDRWLVRRKKHELMWTISLSMFALGSAALFVGASFGWGEWSFKTFYLFGAILNVPFLALGTVYLLADERVGDWCLGIVSLLSAFAAGLIVATPPIAPPQPDVISQGKAVFGPIATVLAGVGSGVASMVIIGGALWSAWRLLRHGGSKRLALANVVITIGVFISAAGGLLNSVADAMTGFTIALVVGIAVIFVGFLLTNSPAPAPAVEPWYPPGPRPATEDDTDEAPDRDVAFAKGSPSLN